MTRDFGGLVEAALGVTLRLQRNRAEAVDVEMQAERARRSCEKAAEDAAESELATILEHLDEVIDRESVAQRCEATFHGPWPGPERPRFDGQPMLAVRAQVGARPLAGPSAAHAARRQRPAAEGL